VVEWVKLVEEMEYPGELIKGEEMETTWRTSGQGYV